MPYKQRYATCRTVGDLTHAHKEHDVCCVPRIYSTSTLALRQACSSTLSLHASTLLPHVQAATKT
jgi:hypothetical protein